MSVALERSLGSMALAICLFPSEELHSKIHVPLSTCALLQPSVKVARLSCQTTNFEAKSGFGAGAMFSLLVWISYWIDHERSFGTQEFFFEAQVAIEVEYTGQIFGEARSARMNSVVGLKAATQFSRLFVSSFCSYLRMHPQGKQAVLLSVRIEHIEYIELLFEVLGVVVARAAEDGRHTGCLLDLCSLALLSARVSPQMLLGIFKEEPFDLSRVYRIWSMSSF